MLCQVPNSHSQVLPYCLGYQWTAHLRALKQQVTYLYKVVEMVELLYLEMNGNCCNAFDIADLYHFVTMRKNYIKIITMQDHLFLRF